MINTTQIVSSVQPAQVCLHKYILMQKAEPLRCLALRTSGGMYYLWSGFVLNLIVLLDYILHMLLWCKKCVAYHSQFLRISHSGCLCSILCIVSNKPAPIYRYQITSASLILSNSYKLGSGLGSYYSGLLYTKLSTLFQRGSIFFDRHMFIISNLVCEG